MLIIIKPALIVTPYHSLIYDETNLSSQKRPHHHRNLINVKIMIPKLSFLKGFIFMVKFCSLKKESRASIIFSSKYAFL